MQGAVHDARLDREIEGGSQLGDHAHDVGRRDRCVPARGQVAGIGCHEIECQIGRRVGEAGRDWRGNRRMRKVGVDQRLELGNEALGPLALQIELEQLDRDKPVLVGVVRTEYRTERARADLVKDAKWTKCLRM
jgi:hypothetical protein